MKYKIANRVINSDQIVKVIYSPTSATSPLSESWCGIETVTSPEDWSVFLRCNEADRFWKVYSADALDVMDA